MEEFLVHYGLVAVFAGAILEGDLTMIMAGVVAHAGYLRLPRAVETACLGAFTGDVVRYVLGRTGAVTVRDGTLYRRGAPIIWKRALGRRPARAR